MNSGQHNVLWFLFMTAQMAGDGGRLELLGLTCNQVVEFTLWFIIPFAHRHSLAICKSLRRVIEIVEPALDMETDLDVMHHAERIAATPQCQRSACSLSGYRNFVIRFVMQDLFDECKLDWEALNSFLGYRGL
jgi:hypothetical protein